MRIAQKREGMKMKAAYLTPAITMFHADGSLDLDSQKKLYENLIAQQ